MAASVHCSMGGTDQIEFYILNERISPSSLRSYLGWYFSNFPILEQLKWFMIYLSRLSQHQSTDLGHEMFVSPGGRTAGPLQRMSCRQPGRVLRAAARGALPSPHGRRVRARSAVRGRSSAAAVVCRYGDMWARTTLSYFCYVNFDQTDAKRFQEGFISTDGYLL